jgi:hypothetical protein
MSSLESPNSFSLTRPYATNNAQPNDHVVGISHGGDPCRMRGVFWPHVDAPPQALPWLDGLENHNMYAVDISDPDASGTSGSWDVMNRFNAR